MSNSISICCLNLAFELYMKWGRPAPFTKVSFYSVTLWELMKALSASDKYKNKMELVSVQYRWFKRIVVFYHPQVNNLPPRQSNFQTLQTFKFKKIMQLLLLHFLSWGNEWLSFFFLPFVLITASMFFLLFLFSFSLLLTHSEILLEIQLHLYIKNCRVKILAFG